MTALLIALQSALCAVFLLAVAGKLVGWRASVEWVTQLGVRFPVPVLTAVVAVEVAIAALVSVRPALSVWPGLAFLAGASAVLYRADRRNLGCACFGGGLAKQVTAASYLRNAALAGGFVLVSVLAAGSGYDTRDLGLVAVPLAVGVAAPAVRAAVLLRPREGW